MDQRLLQPPSAGEATPDAAHRRLAEEMGIRCALKPLFVARYRAAVSNGYIEDEVVHVFGGTYDGEVKPDPGEVADIKWIPLGALIDDLARNPHDYTVWFHHYCVSTSTRSRRGWSAADHGQRRSRRS